MPRQGSANSGPDSLPDVVTNDQSCSYLQLSRPTLYKLAQGGKVPGQMVVKYRRFRKQVIDAWLREREGGEP